MSSPPSSKATVSSPLSTADDSTLAANTKGPASFPPLKTENPRPHVCGTCQRSFARSEHLKRHERSHTKEKPFECRECARCFPRRDLLLRHQQKLHQISSPSSRPRSRRSFARGVFPGKSRARTQSVVGPKRAASDASATSVSLPADTITHVDRSTMQMIAAANAFIAPGTPPTHTHTQHPSPAGLAIYSLGDIPGGISAAMGQRGVQHGQPKLETSTLGGLDFNNSLLTAPSMAAPNAEFDSGSLLIGPGIKTNALHYNDWQHSMALEQVSPFSPFSNELPLSQTLDNSFEWLAGFEYPMSFDMHENVADISSPSAISTTSQSGICDTMFDGWNYPTPAGASTIWQPSVIDPPQMLDPFVTDLNNSVFLDPLDVAPLSPEPASQRTDV